MKIIKIELEGEITGTYSVTIKRWFKTRIKRFKATGKTYKFGGNEYIDEDGESIGSFNVFREAIDKWRNKQEYWKYE
jgi:hypothetical protein